mgnify:CR=1 FL=1
MRFLIVGILLFVASVANAGNVVWTDFSSPVENSDVSINIDRCYLDMSGQYQGYSGVNVVIDFATPEDPIQFASITHVPFASATVSVGRMTSGFGLSAFDDQPLGKPYLSESYGGLTTDGVRVTGDYHGLSCLVTAGTDTYTAALYKTFLGINAKFSVRDSSDVENYCFSGTYVPPVGSALGAEYIVTDDSDSYSIYYAPFSFVGCDFVARYDSFGGLVTTSGGVSRLISQNCRAYLNYHAYESEPDAVQLRWEYSY